MLERDWHQSYTALQGLLTECTRGDEGKPAIRLAGPWDLGFPSLCFNVGVWAESLGPELGCSGSVFPALSQALCMMLEKVTLHCHISLLSFPEERW